MSDPARVGGPDQALVLGARAGDRRCFEVLVRRHQRPAQAVARALGGEAPDVVQEAFLRAWTNLDLLVDPARFGPWLRRIAFACAIDALRRRPPGEPAPLDDLPSPAPPADDALADREVAEAVRAALARLPARYRQPLVLYHLGGLRQERIAAALGVAPGTVRSLVTRARQALRVSLATTDGLLDDPAPRRLLHVCNGHATSRPLEQAGVPGVMRLFCDLLIEGPCPPLWGEAWHRVRGAFLDCYNDGNNGVGRPAPGEELWDDDIAQVLSATSVDEVVLWYEHDLYDQLLLVRFLAVVARHEGPRPPITLVCIGEHPAVPAFKGLGQLTPDQLASLFETRAPVDDAAVALGRDAWAAYTAPDPRPLEALLGRDLSPLPFLARALRRHLERYPAVGDGLTRTERTLLTLVRDGVTDPQAARERLHATEDCHYVPDGVFLGVLERLAAPPAPLLAAPVRTFTAGPLALTPLALDVLRGRRDWLPLAGIDRWLGGVHLTDPRACWRWDPGKAMVIKE